MLQRKLEHTMLAATLCHLDNMRLNMCKWFKSSTGQFWVDVPRNAIETKLIEFERLSKYSFGDGKEDEIEDDE